MCIKVGEIGKNQELQGCMIEMKEIVGMSFRSR